MRIFFLATIVLMCGLLANAQLFSSDPTVNPLTVSTISGMYTGLYMNETRAFLGVPYAQPPVGSLRFKPPQSLSYNWGMTYATQNPPSCWQSSKPAGYVMSEDCLYLNVFTPKNVHGASASLFGNLPVMVFIHGGRYWTGAATDFPGNHLAAVGNAIHVIIQYRLNIFGFQSYDSNTNVGLQDQQMALRWVRDNIRAFGGDPDRVTIYGESAGGSAVLYHLTMPNSYSLYNRVIAHSAWQWSTPNLAQSRNKTVAFAATKGCNNVTSTGAPDYAKILTCLRNIAAVDLVPTTGNSDFFVPIVDGTNIKYQLLSAFKKGAYNKRANVIIGHNYDEGNYMAYSRLGYGTPLTPVTNTTLYNSMVKYLNVYFTPEVRDQVISWYLPVAQQVGNWYGGAEFFGDYYINCGSIMASEYLFEQGANFKNYIFNYSSPNYPASQWFLAASHGNELPYVFFDNIYTPYDLTTADAVLAHRMTRSWVDFADNGNPSGPFARWPSYPNAFYWGPNVMDYDSTVPYRKDICENWRNIFEAY